MNLIDCQATTRAAHIILSKLPLNVQVALTQKCLDLIKTETRRPDIPFSFLSALNSVRGDLDEGHIKPT